MIDPSKAFTAESGFIVDEAAGFFSGADDPTIVGLDVPLGSIYGRTNGTFFIKTGAGFTDWSVGATAAIPGWVLAHGAAHG